MGDEHTVEIRLGVYATEETAARLASACGRLLEARGHRYRLSVVGAGELASGDDGVPLGEFHADLVEQWRLTHPGADPGTRAVHEIRVALSSAPAGTEELRAELARVICPEPGHRSPCEVPWASYATGPAG
ncbi:hypothetical protein HUT19_14085 [Streptomyces sp. NA02950]|uniref:hypothetical protein n=1 Tax=Streptomyces sp. NA02950 TaxID=2742137 RepID=UPI00158FB564|nr:hypothetical protein [Streptomyces sp. NA02950]QKV92743.1 hypothetical protein HUT19_14085 [Streptomyces sp. NA02950]